MEEHTEKGEFVLRVSVALRVFHRHLFSFPFHSMSCMRERERISSPFRSLFPFSQFSQRIEESWMTRCDKERMSYMFILFYFSLGGILTLDSLLVWLKGMK